MERERNRETESSKYAEDSMHLIDDNMTESTVEPFQLEDLIECWTRQLFRRQADDRVMALSDALYLKVRVAYKTP